MKTYEVAIKTGILIFPFIAFLMTLPYLIREYHKYGAISFLRAGIIYSFVLYLLIAYFMVILPLPTFEEVSKLTTPTMQLIPFNFISDIIKNSSIVWNDISSYLKVLKNPVIYTNLFNLILILPFGVYLRYYFKKNFWKTLFYSFLLSLFFELTQLTGLYFIYPRPYRLFDVDDLIINTLGGVIGFAITPIFCLFLPTREKLDEMAFEKGKRVSFSRRTMAYLLDIAIFNILVVLSISIIGTDNILDLYFELYYLYFSVSVLLFKGKTIGKSIVRIKVVKEDGTVANIYQLLYRYFLRYIIFLKMYDIINWSHNVSGLGSFSSFISVVIFVFAVYIYIKTFLDIITKKEQLFYEKMSKTKNISMIEVNSTSSDNSVNNSNFEAN